LCITHVCVGHERDVNDVQAHESSEHMVSVCGGGLLKVWTTASVDTGGARESKIFFPGLFYFLDFAGLTKIKKRKQSSETASDVTNEGDRIVGHTKQGLHIVATSFYQTPLVTLDGGGGAALTCVRWLRTRGVDGGVCVLSGHMPTLNVVDTTTASTCAARVYIAKHICAGIIERRECARALIRLSVHADDRVLAAAMDNHIRVYDLREKREWYRDTHAHSCVCAATHTLACAQLIADVGGAVRDVVWSPGGGAHTFAAIIDDSHMPVVAVSAGACAHARSFAVLRCSLR
jgi:hypothetical protein